MSSSEEECEIIITNFIPIPGPIGPTGSIIFTPGEVYALGDGVTTSTLTYTVYPTFTTVSIDTTLRPSLNTFWDSPTGGRLRYVGGDSLNFLITANLNYSETTSINYLCIAKNGTNIDGGVIRSKTLTTDNVTIATLSNIVSFDTGDYVELMVSGAAPDTITIYSFSIKASL